MEIMKVKSDGEDDDDCLSFTNDSDDDYSVETESTFPVGYHPDGVESDDDESRCCHWSTKQLARSSIIQVQAGSLEFGKPSSELDSDANHIIW